MFNRVQETLSEIDRGCAEDSLDEESDGISEEEQTETSDGDYALDTGRDSVSLAPLLLKRTTF